MTEDEWASVCPTIQQHWQLDARWWYRDVADLDGGLVVSALAELAADGDLTVEPSPSLIRQIVKGLAPAPHFPEDPVASGPSMTFAEFCRRGAPGLYPEDADREKVAREAYEAWGSLFESWAAAKVPA